MVMKIQAVICFVMVCSDAGYQCPPKHLYPTTSLQGVTAKKNVPWIYYNCLKI